MGKDIFISYRRDGAEALAHLLYNRLTADGYEVFLDVEVLRSGKFNEALIQKIKGCKDFVLLLPPHGLDRCAAPEDWVRKELEAAIAYKKNIIPVMMRGFTFPEKLPPSINELRDYNGIEANMEFFDAVITKLETKLLKSKPLGSKVRSGDGEAVGKTVPCPLCHCERTIPQDNEIFDLAKLRTFRKITDKMVRLSELALMALLLLWGASKVEFLRNMILKISSGLPFLEKYITAEAFAQLPKLAVILIAAGCLLVAVGLQFSSRRAKLYRDLLHRGPRNVKYLCRECGHTFKVMCSVEELSELQKMEEKNPSFRHMIGGIIGAIAVWMLLLYLLLRYLLKTFGLIKTAAAVAVIAAILIHYNITSKKESQKS